MSRAVAGTVVLVLFVVSVATAPALASSPQNGLQTPDGFDESTFRITVYENGSATWTLEHRTPLANDTERERFENYVDRFESEETPLYLDFVEDAGLLTRYGTNETGREMDARNFQRSASVDPAQSRGTVQMSFLWTNFAVVDGQRVVVSDVFEGGFYIGEGQSLVVERGPALGFSSARPTPDIRSQPDSLAGSESVTWVGEQSFSDSRPYVELAPRSTVADATSTPAAENGGGIWRFAVLLLVVALGAVAVAAWRSGAAAAVLDSGDDDGGDGATAATPPSDPEPTVSETELLSDSDRVVKLLEENGGRMKQVDIVETTDWSKSKVSMLLSDMEEDGQISKLRVGRENIVSLAGEEPDAAGSPFDEE